jgi:hypothetical protein
MNKQIIGIEKELSKAFNSTESELKEYLHWSGALKHYPEFSRENVINKLLNTYDELCEMYSYEPQF